MQTQGLCRARLIIVFFFMLSASGFSEDISMPRWSLKLTGGASYLAVGHLNVSLASISEILVSGSEGVYSKSVVKELNNWNTAWEAELNFHISRKIGVGIGVSNLLHLSNESNFPIYSWYSDPPGSLVGFFVSRPGIRYRIPITINVHYSLPIFSRTDILFSAGCGYYSGSMKEALDYEISDGSEAWWHRSNWESTWKSALGFHGGIGAEYSFSRRLALVAEVTYRYAKIRNLGATLNIESNLLHDSFSYDEQGTLYLWIWGEEGPLGLASQEFYVWQGNPPEYGGVLFGRSIGKAILDLSGLTLKLGIRIRLF
jgi:opacity protein-like surface antigen